MVRKVADHYLRNDGQRQGDVMLLNVLRVCGWDAQKPRPSLQLPQPLIGSNRAYRSVPLAAATLTTEVLCQLRRVKHFLLCGQMLNSRRLDQ